MRKSELLHFSYSYDGRSVISPAGEIARRGRGNLRATASKLSVTILNPCSQSSIFPVLPPGTHSRWGHKSTKRSGLLHFFLRFVKTEPCFAFPCFFLPAPRCVAAGRLFSRGVVRNCMERQGEGLGFQKMKKCGIILI